MLLLLQSVKSHEAHSRRSRGGKRRFDHAGLGAGSKHHDPMRQDRADQWQDDRVPNEQQAGKRTDKRYAEVFLKQSTAGKRLCDQIRERHSDRGRQAKPQDISRRGKFFVSTIDSEGAIQNDHHDSESERRSRGMHQGLAHSFLDVDCKQTDGEQHRQLDGEL